MGTEKDAAQQPWRQVYEAALLELDPTKLLDRINQAHRAILDRMEELLTAPVSPEHKELNDTLRTLSDLRKLASKTDTDL